jgi:hypothetical protein
MHYIEADMPEINSRRRKKTWGYVLVILAVIVLIFEFFSVRTASQENTFGTVFRVVLILNALYSGIQKIREAGRIYYTRIDASGIEWFNENMESPMVVEWKDLRWIKADQRGSVIFSRSSSFSAVLSMQQYSTDKQKNIQELISNFADQFQVQKVNF